MHTGKITADTSFYKRELDKAKLKISELEDLLLKTRKELFILASDVSLCGFGVSAALLDKSKRICERIKKGE